MQDYANKSESRDVQGLNLVIKKTEYICHFLGISNQYANRSIFSIT